MLALCCKPRPQNHGICGVDGTVSEPFIYPAAIADEDLRYHDMLRLQFPRVHRYTLPVAPIADQIKTSSYRNSAQRPYCKPII